MEYTYVQYTLQDKPKNWHTVLVKLKIVQCTMYIIQEVRKIPWKFVDLSYKRIRTQNRFRDQSRT
jgi:hypothetical protein